MKKLLVILFFAPIAALSQNCQWVSHNDSLFVVCGSDSTNVNEWNIYLLLSKMGKGLSGQVLKKNSNITGDYSWETMTGGIAQQTLNDSANAIRSTVNGKSESNHNHSGVYQPSGSYLVAADIAGKQNTISLTTTGTSGPATFNGTTLNIPNYATGGGSSPTFLNLVSNFSSTSITPAIVTGWSFAVTTGKTYRITVVADYQTAIITTGGILGISLTTATGSVRGYAYGAVSQSAAATELKIPIRTFSGAGSTLTTTGVSVANSPHYIGLDITFTCTGTGTFNIVWGTEIVATAAQLNANSSLIYQVLN